MFFKKKKKILGLKCFQNGLKYLKKKHKIKTVFFKLFKLLTIKVYNINKINKIIEVNITIN